MPWVNHLVEHTVGVLNIRRSNSAKINNTESKFSNVASIDTQVHFNFASIDTGAS